MRARARGGGGSGLHAIRTGLEPSYQVKAFTDLKGRHRTPPVSWQHLPEVSAAAAEILGSAAGKFRQRSQDGPVLTHPDSG